MTPKWKTVEWTEFFEILRKKFPDMTDHEKNGVANVYHDLKECGLVVMREEK